MEFRGNVHFLVLRSLTYFFASLSTIGGVFLYVNGIKFWWVWFPLVCLLIYAVGDIVISPRLSQKHIKDNTKAEEMTLRLKLTAIFYGYFSVAIFGLAPGLYLLLKYANTVIHYKSKVLVWPVIIALGIPLGLGFWFGRKLERLPQVKDSLTNIKCSRTFVRNKTYNLPNARLAVIQALLTAVGSWVFSLWLIGLPFWGSRFYILGGLSVCGILVISIIITSIPLICPKCGKRLAFISKPLPLLPDWAAVKQQYFPFEAVSRKRAKCPHCGAEISLQKGTTPNNGSHRMPISPAPGEFFHYANNKNIIPWTCHVCGAKFDTLGGGICPECNKPTCRICFAVGTLYQLSRKKNATKIVCKACAKPKTEETSGLK